MGQSASLYRIEKNDFAKIVESPTDFGLFKITKGYETFEKSFEGLRFVLSKGLDSSKKDLVMLIFYPATCIGDSKHFSDIDPEDLPEDLDFEEDAVFYNEPEIVSEICDLLDTISLEKFRENFDHHELNKEDIYPGDIWNDQTDKHIAFNARHLGEEFQKLKSLFRSAKENGDYLLSYVG